jgi:hypothetical protein
MDVLMLGILAALVALSWGFVRVCERTQEGAGK